MNIFEFAGKVLCEDIPTLIFDKIPECVDDGLEKVSDAIDKALD